MRVAKSPAPGLGPPGVAVALTASRCPPEPRTAPNTTALGQHLLRYSVVARRDLAARARIGSRFRSRSVSICRALRLSTSCWQWGEEELAYHVGHVVEGAQQPLWPDRAAQEHGDAYHVLRDHDSVGRLRLGGRQTSSKSAYRLGEPGSSRHLTSWTQVFIFLTGESPESKRRCPATAPRARCGLLSVSGARFRRAPGESSRPTPDPRPARVPGAASARS